MNAVNNQSVPNDGRASGNGSSGNIGGGRVTEMYSSSAMVDDLLPPQLHNVLNFPIFNAMQQTLFQQSFHSDMNMVVAAPTGSGKTVIMELAILRLHQQKQSSLRTMKVVYIAPNKALCQQRWFEWHNKFHQRLSLNVLEVTGDVELKDSLRTIAKAHIIITTPEKWDSLTRLWRDHVFLMGAIDLLLIDEIHHLGEDRGPILEMVIVRMRMISEICREKAISAGSQSLENLTHDNANRKRLRIVGLSATLPNLGDIGEWLQCTEAGIHYFDDSFRPIPLQAITLVCGNMGNPFLFDRSLDNRVKDVIAKYSEGKQTLIFCSSKNNAQNLAMKLRDQSAAGRQFSTSNVTIPGGAGGTGGGGIGRSMLSQMNNPDVLRVVNALQDETLKGLVLQGYGYHHAGLPPDDRAILEELFLKGYIRILCSTSTLAHGVNLPAHLVIIKGTYSWRGSTKGYEKMGRSDVIQMLGRAGRPGFDSHGIAVIMTSNEDRQYYSNLSLSADLVESKLTSILPEAMVAEISQTVIKSVLDAKNWIMSTFFYIRVKNHMRATHKEGQPFPNIEMSMEKTCLAVLQQLHEATIINYDASSGQVSANPEAYIMSRHLTKFSSMKILLKIQGITDLPKVLRTVCTCEELAKPVRRAEKKPLNEWMSKVRYPLKERVQQSSQKAYVLLLAAISRIPMKDFTLKIEQAELVDNSMRLLRCLHDLSIEREQGSVLEATILLERALRTRLWESGITGGNDTVGGNNIFTQCDGLSDRTLKTLIEVGYTIPGHLQGCSLTHLTTVLGCSPEEARALLYFSQELLQSRLIAVASIESNSNKQRSSTTMGTRTLTVSVFPAESTSSANSSNSSATISYQLVCIDAKSGNLLIHRNLLPQDTGNVTVGNDGSSRRRWEFSVTIPPSTPGAQQETSSSALPPLPIPTQSTTTKKKVTQTTLTATPNTSAPMVEEQVKVCLYANIVGIDFVKDAVLLADPNAAGKNKITIRNTIATPSSSSTTTAAGGTGSNTLTTTAARVMQPSEFGISSTPRNPFEAFKLDYNPPLNPVLSVTTGNVPVVTPSPTSPPTTIRTNKKQPASKKTTNVPTAPAAKPSSVAPPSSFSAAASATAGGVRSQRKVPTAAPAHPPLTPPSNMQSTSSSRFLAEDMISEDDSPLEQRAHSPISTTSHTTRSVAGGSSSRTTLASKCSKEVSRDSIVPPQLPRSNSLYSARQQQHQQQPSTSRFFFFDEDWQRDDSDMGPDDDTMFDNNEQRSVEDDMRSIATYYEEEGEDEGTGQRENSIISPGSISDASWALYERSRSKAPPHRPPIPKPSTGIVANSHSRSQTQRSIASRDKQTAATSNTWSLLHPTSDKMGHLSSEVGSSSVVTDDDEPPDERDSNSFEANTTREKAIDTVNNTSSFSDADFASAFLF